jgi:ankyrin repeat protein
MSGKKEKDKEEKGKREKKAKKVEKEKKTGKNETISRRQSKRSRIQSKYTDRTFDDVVDADHFRNLLKQSRQEYIKQYGKNPPAEESDEHKHQSEGDMDEGGDELYEEEKENEDDDDNDDEDDDDEDDDEFMGVDRHHKKRKKSSTSTKNTKKPTKKKKKKITERQKQDNKRLAREELRRVILDEFNLNSLEMQNLSTAQLISVADQGRRTNLIDAATLLTRLHREVNFEIYTQTLDKANNETFGDIDGATELVRLLHFKLGLNVKLPDGNTLLSRAILDNVMSSVYISVLLAHPGVPVNTVDSTGKSPLVRAIASGNQHATDLLLECERVNRDEEGRVLRAVLNIMRTRNRNFVKSVIRRVIHHSSNVNVCSVGGVPALLMAYRFGYKRMISVLLQHPELNINQRIATIDNIQEGENLLIILIARFLNSQQPISPLPPLLMEVMTHPNIDVNLYYGGQSLLMKVLLRIGPDQTVWRHRVILQLLDNSNIDVNVQDMDGNCALSIALRNSNTPLVRSLLSRPDIIVRPSMLQLTRNDARLDVFRAEITRRLVTARAVLVDATYEEALVGLEGDRDALRLVRDYVYDDNLHHDYINRP